MKKIILFLAVLLISSQACAAEKVNLSTPYDPDPRQENEMVVSRVLLDWELKIIEINLVGKNDPSIVLSKVYNGGIAETLMLALNKMDFSSVSLQKRIMERLISDGVISGTVSGSPD